VPALSQDQKIRIIRRMCGYIPHAAELGLELVAIEGEELTLRLPYRRELVGNPDTGALHGGALTVLLDQTLGIASICSDRVGAMITPTLDLRIDHLGVAPAGRDVLAAGRVYRASRRVLFIEGEAWCETRDRPIARATGTWVMRPDLDLEPLLHRDQAGAQQQ